MVSCIVVNCSKLIKGKRKPRKDCNNRPTNRATSDSYKTRKKENGLRHLDEMYFRQNVHRVFSIQRRDLNKRRVPS